LLQKQTSEIAGRFHRYKKKSVFAALDSAATMSSQQLCTALDEAEEMIAAVESQFEAEILRRVASSLNVEL
ncbi:HERC1, partial [Symbiodinium sp. KB8]